MAEREGNGRRPRLLGPDGVEMRKNFDAEAEVALLTQQVGQLQRVLQEHRETIGAHQVVLSELVIVVNSLTWRGRIRRWTDAIERGGVRVRGWFGAAAPADRHALRYEGRDLPFSDAKPQEEPKP